MPTRPPVPTPAPDPGPAPRVPAAVREGFAGIDDNVNSSTNEPEIEVGPVLEGYAVVFLSTEDGGERIRIAAPVQAARVHGAWTLIPLAEMRSALEEGLGAGTVAAAGEPVPAG